MSRLAQDLEKLSVLVKAQLGEEVGITPAKPDSGHSFDPEHLLFRVDPRAGGKLDAEAIRQIATKGGWEPPVQAAPTPENPLDTSLKEVEPA